MIKQADLEKRQQGALNKAIERSQISAPPPSFISLEQLTSMELRQLISDAIQVKENPQGWSKRLEHRSIALLFQQTSTRTRCSFERAMFEMGGSSSYIDWRSSNFMLGDVHEEAKVMSRYYDAIVARTSHEILLALADSSEVPMINGMTEKDHPCQIVTDYMTIHSFFAGLSGLHLVYLGDPNNICYPLMTGAIKLGIRMTICSPREYLAKADFIKPNPHIQISSNPHEAVKTADVIYTDTWVSMGQEAETEKRCRDFMPFQVNETLLSHAPSHALVMHCLPAHRELEITTSVLRGQRSIVFDQAENRKNAQKAILVKYIGGDN